MIVKICGIRSLEDACGAVDAGADMLGFNFYRPSPRYIDPGACAQLLAALRRRAGRVPVLVGVFVNSPIGETKAILEGCGLDFAQLHGDEPAETLSQFGGRAFKAIRPRGPESAREDMAAFRTGAARTGAPDILLDASAPGLYGGSGRTGDWSVAAALAGESRVLLAGGLHPGNIAEAIVAVQPWGVDVASGVEVAPGVKDAVKMRLFVEQARMALARS